MSVEVHVVFTYTHDGGVEIKYASLDAQKAATWLRSQKKWPTNKKQYVDKWGYVLALGHFPLDQEIDFPE